MPQEDVEDTIEEANAWSAQINIGKLWRGNA
jgi:hypothetical protein